jgi:antitoxin ParD1/3/4
MNELTLDRHFEEFINQQIAAGRFHDASEVIAAGLRLLEHEDQSLEIRRDRLIAEIDAAFSEEGADMDLAGVFDALEARVNGSAP